MENQIFITKQGKIELTPGEMCNISERYEILCTKDFLEDTYPYVDEDILMEVSHEVRRYMFKYDFTEEEAINEILSKDEYIKIFNYNDYNNIFNGDDILGINNKGDDA